jgi:hypothetical protein
MSARSGNDSRIAHWNGVRRRALIVGKALELPPAEVEEALKYKGLRVKPILDFASRHYQTLDWLLGGDTGSMCHALAWAHGWRPSGWTPDKQPKRRCPHCGSEEHQARYQCCNGVAF